jgi:hypothetical protein
LVLQLPRLSESTALPFLPGVVIRGTDSNLHSFSLRLVSSTSLLNNFFCRDSQIARSCSYKTKGILW